MPSIAVIGRQNVGKSTLVNRLFGHRQAIAHDLPGVTRDRVTLETAWRGRRFSLVDTAGFLHDAGGIEALAREQADRAIAAADLILLIVDVHAGITEEDAMLARRLRRATVPVLVVANKVDTDREEPDATAFHALGLGDPFPVSGMHGRGAAICSTASRSCCRMRQARWRHEPRSRGSPSSGGRTWASPACSIDWWGEERSVVFEEAGTTRDAVDALVEWPDGPVRFVDTAGMRRATRVRGVEYFSVVRSTQAIERAHVAMLVIDADQGYTVEDKKIANVVLDTGARWCSWRTSGIWSRTRTILTPTSPTTARQFASSPVMRTSARTGRGVHRLPSVSSTCTPDGRRGSRRPRSTR